MNKDGFTLVEMLTVIVLIGLISCIAYVSYDKLIANGNGKYYEVLEETIELAGSDYYADHRDKIPSNGEVSEISLGDLVDSSYIEPVKDSRGNTCVEGHVYARKENGRLVYEVCLECDNYQSNEAKCKKYEKK